MPHAESPVALFLEPVATWFHQRFGSPTPPQRMGWPLIAQRRHTLIIAPTGSGKTLAAFLACLDALWRDTTSPAHSRGTRLLYISPLKALNADVARNLVEPLEGILTSAADLGTPLRPIRVGVRTGDTPSAERERMRRRPPDVLITTPESLHLLLTSRARETLRSVRFVILDEIHALCDNKRGVFLSLLLERLQALCPDEFTRVGLSATQRPLDEVARYLGGRRRVAGRGPTAVYEPRAVAIVDAGARKQLDLAVHYPGPVAPGGSVWPAIEDRLIEGIAAHRSTIVFANNRRVVERLASALNERAAEIHREPDSVLARPHHGSLSLDLRRSTENALKDGRLPAVVATASLELGIDMGAVELVCQVESPGSVSRGLQRVGRAGHVVGQVSRGRLYAKTLPDLLESAALVRAMRSGDVERLRVPVNCLDVLAQQLVACVAAGPVDALDLYDLVRSAYPYANLGLPAFEDVLRMISGRFGMATFRDLRPRVSWDRVHHRLLPLPGTAALALVGGGTIPDTGQYPLHLGADGPRLGELDEEFVLERRIGETFRLGQGTWRIEAIEPHRVVVSPAEGHAALLPFWRGESAGRTAELGEAVARLTREIAERLDANAETTAWLAAECGLDRPSAEMLARFVARQRTLAGAAPDDRTILVEAFTDPAGELGLAILSPHGHRVHHALKLALQGHLRARFGLDLAALHDDDGLLFRLPGMDDPPLDLLDRLTPDLADELVRDELGDSALFGLRFRQNAGRALLMPRPDPARRTPLWLQRLRARDLLQAVRRHPDFPVVIETYRECLDADLDLPRLRALLASIQNGTIRVVTRRAEVPSPFASELIFKFTRTYLYEWDEPKRGDRPPAARPDQDRLDAVLDGRSAGFQIELDPHAIERVEQRLRGERPPRSADEMAEWLRRVGDLVPSELHGPMASFLETLASEGRAARFPIPDAAEPDRWISAEELDLYHAAFALDPNALARSTIIERHVATRALVGVGDLTRRYGLDPAEATSLLEALSEDGGLVRLGDSDEEPARWADRRNLADVRRVTLALRRRDAIAVPPETFADFLLARHHLQPATRLEGPAALAAVLDRLDSFAAPLSLWEQELLPRRIAGFRPASLDESVRRAGLLPRAVPGPRGEPLVAFLSAAEAVHPTWPAPAADPPLTPHAEAVQAALLGRGACHVDDLATATRLSPSQIHKALLDLLALGLVSVDRLDPLRDDAEWTAVPAALAPTLSGVRPRLGRLRRSASARPQPRWTLWPDSTAPIDDPDTPLLAWAERLLDRHAVLCRETAALDPAAPPWRELADPLARAELRGELRRGYFVEGLSGVQYALPETADALARHRPNPSASPVLVNSLDPANLYGSGAPLDIPLLEGGTVRFTRAAGNYLAILAGRPILMIEAHGKRLTGLPSASESEIQAALALLPTLAGPSRRVLKVETYNTAPALASPAAPWLAALGFVRNPPGLALYAGW
jgi:ATP-dependent Lhr-like helicase